MNRKKSVLCVLISQRAYYPTTPTTTYTLTCQAASIRMYSYITIYIMLIPEFMLLKLYIYMAHLCIWFRIKSGTVDEGVSPVQNCTHRHESVRTHRPTDSFRHKAFGFSWWTLGKCSGIAIEADSQGDPLDIGTLMPPIASGRADGRTGGQAGEQTITLATA